MDLRKSLRQALAILAVAGVAGCQPESQPPGDDEKTDETADVSWQCATVAPTALTASMTNRMLRGLFIAPARARQK